MCICVGSSARRCERKRFLCLCALKKAPCLLWKARQLKNVRILTCKKHDEDALFMRRVRVIYALFTHEKNHSVNNI